MPQDRSCGGGQFAKIASGLKRGGCTFRVRSHTILDVDSCRDRSALSSISSKAMAPPLPHKPRRGFLIERPVGIDLGARIMSMNARSAAGTWRCP